MTQPYTTSGLLKSSRWSLKRLSNPFLGTASEGNFTPLAEFVPTRLTQAIGSCVATANSGRKVVSNGSALVSGSST